MKAIINGRIVLPGAVLRDKALLFDEKILGAAGAFESCNIDIIDARDGYVIPGLIDMHIHGYLGADASDGSAAGLLSMAEGIIRNGVTGWLPTTMTVSQPELRAAFAQIRSLMRPGANPRGAQVLGVNAEGPFINPIKKGAQAGEHIRPADAAFLKEFADVIRVFTVAPEMPGNLDCIREMAGDGRMLISMGHTAASYDQARAGIEAGVRHTTHLFNAMTPMLHRDPGAVGAALGDDRVSVELIADCFHVHPGLFQLVARLKGDRLILITDCTRAGGLPDGEYSLGGQPIFVKGIECRLADGTIAGSVLKLNEAVRNVLRETSLPVQDVVNMASLNPARVLGLAQRKGSLEPGKDADVVIADADFNVSRVFIGGELRWER